MAEAIGIGSGVVALANFALQSGQTLSGVIDSYRNRNKAVRELKKELEALETVLRSLQDTLTDPEIDLSSLKLPLLRCGEACRGFAETIDNCTARSSKDKTSFSDWLRLTYRGRNIRGFKDIIEAYKSTITIALADANM